eukprot:tig00001284_g8012.t1
MESKATPEPPGDGRPALPAALQSVVDFLRAVIPKKFFGFLPRRRTLSTIGVLIVAILIIFLGGWYYTAAIAAMQAVCLREYFALVKAKGYSPTVRTTILASLVHLASAQAFPMYSDGFIALAGMFIIFYLLLHGDRLATIADLSGSILGLFYLGYFPGFVVRLRNLEQREMKNFPFAGYWPQTAAEWKPALWPRGLQASFLMMLCIAASDIGAYIIGKSFGRTKLITKISPKKTWEGACGGFASAMLIGAVGFWAYAWPGGPLLGALFGLTMSGVGLLGDLTESLMKRDAGVKDSGDIIPGHGGMLDRLDSFIFTSPIAYYFVTLLLPLFAALRK